jgi:hypothetical protein
MAAEANSEIIAMKLQQTKSQDSAAESNETKPHLNSDTNNTIKDASRSTSSAHYQTVASNNVDKGHYIDQLI